MKNLILLTFLLTLFKFGLSSNSNYIAYKFGEFIGMLIPIGVIVLIIWLIVKTISKNKKHKE
jgi:large-conductance mechanosensitive channel